MTHDSFRPFFLSSPRPQVASLDTPHTECIIVRRSRQGSAFGGWKMNLSQCHKKQDKSHIWEAETHKPLATKFCPSGAVHDLVTHALVTIG